jgi:hypothetical protein
LITVSAEAEDLRDVGFVGGAVGVVLLVLLEIVLAVRHAEAALGSPDSIAGRVSDVGFDADAEGCGVADLGNDLQQAGLVGDAVDFVEIGLQRFDAARFERGFVHP